MFTTYSKEDLESSLSEKIHVVETPKDKLVDKYELKKCLNWIETNRYERTCLQFPQHLLNDSTSIALYMQRCLDRPVYILADTSYGSCCVDEVAAEHVNGDSIIHFSHACLSPVTKLPLLYIFEKEDLDIEQLSEKLDIFENEPVLVFYDDVYHHLYNELCSIHDKKPNVKISSLNLSHSNLQNEANEKIKCCTILPSKEHASREILNHEDSESKVNERIICGRIFPLNIKPEISAVYIGDESITLQNLVLSLPEFSWYRYTNNNELIEFQMNINKFLMQRSHLVEKVKEAATIGILIGTLGIKNFMDAAERIKILAKSKKKKCYMLAVGKPNVAKLANFPEIDVFVCVSCQENSLLKNHKDYFKPIVSIFEVEMALGGRPYSVNYTSDFRELLPGGSFHKEINIETDPNASSSETSQELLERDPGTMIESRGAEFLMNRTWKGLEQKIGETEVCKAVPGRRGTAQAYENELTTLSEDK